MDPTPQPTRELQCDSSTSRICRNSSTVISPLAKRAFNISDGSSLRDGSSCTWSCIRRLFPSIPWPWPIPQPHILTPPFFTIVPPVNPCSGGTVPTGVPPFCARQPTVPIRSTARIEPSPPLRSACLSLTKHSSQPRKYFACSVRGRCPHFSALRRRPCHPRLTTRRSPWPYRHRAFGPSVSVATPNRPSRSGCNGALAAVASPAENGMYFKASTNLAMVCRPKPLVTPSEPLSETGCAGARAAAYLTSVHSGYLLHDFNAGDIFIDHAVDRLRVPGSHLESNRLLPFRGFPDALPPRPPTPPGPGLLYHTISYSHWVHYQVFAVALDVDALGSLPHGAVPGKPIQTHRRARSPIAFRHYEPPSNGV